MNTVQASGDLPFGLSRPATARILGAILLLAAIGGTGWAVWSYGLTGGAAGGGAIELDALCDKCGYFDRVDVGQLVSNGTAARTPAFGPGYQCPKCREASLYTNPSICEGCRTRYLVSADRNGVVKNKCPQCGRFN